MEDYRKTLSDKLLYIMGAEEYTLQEMSDICGISKRKLCEIIYQEEKGLNISTLIKISNGTGIPLTELISEKEG